MVVHNWNRKQQAFILLLYIYVAFIQLLTVDLTHCLRVAHISTGRANPG